MNWNNIQQKYGADLKSKPVIFDSVSLKTQTEKEPR